MLSRNPSSRSPPDPVIPNLLSPCLHRSGHIEFRVVFVENLVPVVLVEEGLVAADPHDLVYTDLVMPDLGVAFAEDLVRQIH